MVKVGLKRWGAMMKFRNYCKRLEVEAKGYRAIGSDGAVMVSDGQRYRTMESDGNDCRTMTEQQKHKGIKGDAQKDAKAMQRAMF